MSIRTNRWLFGSGHVPLWHWRQLLDPILGGLEDIGTVEYRLPLISDSAKVIKNRFQLYSYLVDTEMLLFTYYNARC